MGFWTERLMRRLPTDAREREDFADFQQGPKTLAGEGGDGVPHHSILSQATAKPCEGPLVSEH